MTPRGFRGRCWLRRLQRAAEASSEPPRGVMAALGRERWTGGGVLVLPWLSRVPCSVLTMAAAAEGPVSSWEVLLLERGRRWGPSFPLSHPHKW